MSEEFEDGLGMALTFSLNASLLFYPKSITPSGYDARGGTDVSRLDNEEWVTMAPKRLKTATPIKIVASFESGALATAELEDMIGVNQMATEVYPDGAERDIWGWIDKFDISEFKEGEQPTVTIDFIPSNRNGSGVETGPAYRAAP